MVIILCVIGIALIAVDQLIKHWAVTSLMPVYTMDFIKFGNFDVIGFKYAENDGAAFSSFSGAKYFLIIFNIALMVGLVIYLLKKSRKDKFLLITVMMIVSGGLGNIIDRIRLGYVIDYIEVRFFDFAIFNFADMLVVVGACLLLVYTFFFDKSDDVGKTDE